jgi:phosphatidylinositol 4-phosphatase
MQGYYQIAYFHVPPMNGGPDELALVDYVVISRRSRDRAGLRYQRRGVGEEGTVANFVETESVVRVQVSRSSSLGSVRPAEFYFAAGRSD